MNTKTTIIKSLKDLVADRYLLVLVLLLVILSIVFSIIIGLSIHPSELQLVSHYSDFGVTHLYRDQWFYLFSFVLFGIVVAVLHTIIAIKLLVVKGRSFAIMFAWVGIGIILLGCFVTAMAVINVWKPL